MNVTVAGAVVIVVGACFVMIRQPARAGHHERFCRARAGRVAHLPKLHKQELVAHLYKRSHG